MKITRIHSRVQKILTQQKTDPLSQSTNRHYHCNIPICHCVIRVLSRYLLNQTNFKIIGLLVTLV